MALLFSISVRYFYRYRHRSVAGAKHGLVRWCIAMVKAQSVKRTVVGQPRPPISKWSTVLWRILDSCWLLQKVKPKKRGVKRDTIRTVLTSYTIADIFLTLKGLIFWFKSQKTDFSVQGQKKMESLLIAVMRWPIGAQGSDQSGHCFSG